MNVLTHILQYFASLTRPHPSRDWFFGLGVVLILFVGLLSYAAYLFISINSGAAFAGGEAPAPHTISLTSADIETVLEMYRTRSVNYAAHNYPSPAVIDPTK